MKKWCLAAVMISLFSFETSARGALKGDKIPLDIRVYMSILSKKGTNLTDYEKTYMENLGHGDVKEAPIDPKTFHRAFIDELDNNSQAKTYYESGQERLDQEKREKKK